MKPYGNTRKDNLACKYNCCHGVRGGGYRPFRLIRRASARRARQESRKICSE